ncbi:MAG: hypothetical protein HY000_29915 [Planctomycetes bacterium]|nr:hypothetical protein [Planctomycetota bacterium]
MINLSEQQRKALDAGEAVEITDGRIIHVFTKDEYERVKRLMSLEEINPSLFEVSRETYDDEP